MPRLQHKIGRKSNYLKSLNNPNHKEVKRRALVRDGFKCQNNGCSSKLFLELHHITYYLFGISILGHELENDNLKWTVIVCDKCHQEIHNTLEHKWNPNNRFKRHGGI